MQSSDPQSALVVVGLAVAVLSVFWTAAGVFTTLLTKENGGVKAKEDYIVEHVIQSTSSRTSKLFQ